MEKDKGTVFYIGGFELPDKNAAAQRVLANGKLLRDLGYNVVFDGITKDENADSSMSETFFGFEAYAQHYPKGFWNWLIYTCQFKRYLNLIQNFPDLQIIICYNLPSVSLWRLRRYAKKKGIIILSDCTEWYMPSRQGNLIRRIVKKLDIRLRMEFIQTKLDGIISISAYLHHYYSERNVPSVIIPPLVDLKDEKWKNSLVQSDEKIQILYAGSPFSLSVKSNAKDRLDLIVQALASLKKEGCQFKFQVAGISKTDFVDFFPALKTDVDILGEDIVFHGKIPHLKAIELLQKSDYSIFLRDNNIVTKAGFPTKFVESISCGIPVITNRSSNIADFLREGANGFWIDTENSNTIKKSIGDAITTNKDKLREIKNNCYSSEIFDYRAYKKTMNDFLSSID